MRISKIVCVALFLICGRIVDGAEYTLVKDGKPQAEIVLAEKPVKAAQLGAFELQEHIKQITGATLPIVKGKPQGQGLKLFVGNSKAAVAAEAPADLKSQEYAVVFKPGSIIMIGKDNNDTGEVKYWSKTIPGAYEFRTWPELFEEMGSLYAVYDFLEKYCGVRWFDNSEFGTDVPHGKTLSVKAGDLRLAPAFRYRDPEAKIKANMGLIDRQMSNWTVRRGEPSPKYQAWLKIKYEKGRAQPECKHPHRWLAYQRSLTYAFLLRRKLGGEKYKTNHSLYEWYDRFWEKNPRRPSVFETKRPEFFAQGYPHAKRPPQLCYSNPAVAEQLIRDMYKFYSLPAAQIEKSRLGTEKFYPVVPMDNSSYCKCPECKKIDTPTKLQSGAFTNGKHSRIIWTFINKIARALKKKYPDKYISALAYASYAYRPDNMKIEDNIAVQLCLFPHFAATNSKGLKSDDMLLKQWNDGRPVYLWLYSGLTTGARPVIPWFPKPSGTYMGTVLRKYHKAGVKGIFFNGFPQEVDTYFMLKLTEDPYQNVDKLIDDYFVRMYGTEAGKTMKEFYLTMSGIYANPRNYSKGIAGPNLEWGILGTGPRMKKLQALVDKAEKELAANGTELQKKRFNLFKFGTWDYMLKGRKEYETAKFGKKHKARDLSMICPAILSAPPKGDTAKVDWNDATITDFCWKDNGDSSLRIIETSMLRDDRYLYLKLEEKNLESKPVKGDSWTIAFFDKKRKMKYLLNIDFRGKVSGTEQGVGGAPQEWNSGAVAASNVNNKVWHIMVAIPLKDKPFVANNSIRMNWQRNDSAEMDSPVWVCTNNQFDTGNVSAVVRLDKMASGKAELPIRSDLYLEWNFADKQNLAKDSSGHGHNGINHDVKSKNDDGINTAKFYKAVNRHIYIETGKLDNFDKNIYTFSCWFKYERHIRSAMGGRLFIFGDLFFTICQPQYQILVLSKTPQGKRTGAGPTGAILPPEAWHHLVISNDGKMLRMYENGRERLKMRSSRLSVPSADARIRIGGGPKHIWFTNLNGEMSQVRIYNKVLGPDQILAQYKAEYKKYKQGKVSK